MTRFNSGDPNAAGVDPGSLPPSKDQIAFVVNPVTGPQLLVDLACQGVIVKGFQLSYCSMFTCTFRAVAAAHAVRQVCSGLMSLLFLPFFESNFALPSVDSAVVVGICATGILVFELLLTELTSPLTVWAPRRSLLVVDNLSRGCRRERGLCWGSCTT